MDNAIGRAAVDAAIIGPVTSAAVHNVSLTALYKILNEPKGNSK